MLRLETNYQDQPVLCADRIYQDAGPISVLEMQRAQEEV